MNEFYVYVYLNTMKPGHYSYNGLEFDYEPFYVGKGKNDRFIYHLNKVKNKNNYKSSSKFEIIERCIKFGIEPMIIKLYSNITEYDSLLFEKETVVKIGRIDIGNGPLTNRNDGGHKPQDNYHHDDITKKKLSISGRNRLPQERYDLISPNNINYSNINLFEFCKKNKLNYHKLRKSSNKGKIKIRKTINCNIETFNCDGWEVINKKNIKSDNKILKYILISPNNIKYEIYNISGVSKFVDDLDLNIRTLRMYRNTGKIEIRNIEQCKNKKSINCQGWQFIDINKEEYVVKSEAKSKYILIDLANNEYIISNLKDFCYKHNLSERTFRTFRNRGKVNMNKRKNYSKNILNTIGWECLSID